MISEGQWKLRTLIFGQSVITMGILRSTASWLSGYSIYHLSSLPSQRSHRAGVLISRCRRLRDLLGMEQRAMSPGHRGRRIYIYDKYFMDIFLQQNEYS